MSSVPWSKIIASVSLKLVSGHNVSTRPMVSTWIYDIREAEISGRCASTDRHWPADLILRHHVVGFHQSCWWNLVNLGLSRIERNIGNLWNRFRRLITVPQTFSLKYPEFVFISCMTVVDT